MCSRVVKNVIAIFFFQACSSQLTSRAASKVEVKPLLLESYIPPTMQILAYLTEQMKYDLRPTTTPPPLGPTTPSTMRPTPPHRPAVYAPDAPLGPDAYFESITKELDHIEKLWQNTGNHDYFDRYKFLLGEKSERQDSGFPKGSRSSENQEIWNEDSLGLSESMANYYGKNYIEFWKQVKQVESDNISNDIDAQAQEFLKKYDDSNFRLVLSRQRQIPPTRAYVTLLSLYDLLNKESRRLGLNKYSGYTDRILKELVEGSKSTSSYQLRMVLTKVLDHDDTKTPEIVKKIKNLIADIDEPNSYINLAIRYIVPLPFTL